jgi:hypothetical protein
VRTRAVGTRGLSSASRSVSRSVGLSRVGRRWLLSPARRGHDFARPLAYAGGTLVTTTVQPKDGRAVFFVVEAERFRLANLAQRLGEGRPKPIVGTVRPLTEAPAAFTPDRRTPGKIGSRPRAGQARCPSAAAAAAAGTLVTAEWQAHVMTRARSITGQVEVGRQCSPASQRSVADSARVSGRHRHRHRADETATADRVRGQIRGQDHLAVHPSRPAERASAGQSAAERWAAWDSNPELAD